MSQFQHPNSRQSRQRTRQTAAGDGQVRRGGQRRLVGRQFATNNHLPQEIRTDHIAILNQLLVDATVVHGQVKSAHWNVRGPNFAQLHELFEEVAETLAEHIDAIAERAAALGGEALGTVPIAAQNTTIPQLPTGVSEERQLLSAVADRLAAFDDAVYRNMQAIADDEDPDTLDLLSEVSRDVSKALWFVEAHLQRQTGAQTQVAGGGQMAQQQMMTDVQ